jgi:hypothetical protein
MVVTFTTVFSFTVGEIFHFGSHSCIADQKCALAPHGGHEEGGPEVSLRNLDGEEILAEVQGSPGDGYDQTMFGHDSSRADVYLGMGVLEYIRQPLPIQH